MRYCVCASYLKLIQAFLVDVVGLYSACRVTDRIIQSVFQVHELLVKLAQFVFDALRHILIIQCPVCNVVLHAIYHYRDIGQSQHHTS